MTMSNSNSNSNSNNNGTNQIPTARAIEAARLGFIGASIAALGDGIAAVAAGLALEELVNPSDQRSQNTTYRSKKNETTQQIDYLINELIQIRKSM